MIIQLKQITSKLVFAIALGCLSHTAKAEPFHWNSFSLKVAPKNADLLLELLDETFSIQDKQFKVTLNETIFSDDDVTHGLTVSSNDVDALGELWSDEYKEPREQFMRKLQALAEIKAKFTGVRTYTTNIPEGGSDKKNTGSYFGIWEMEIKAADGPKFVESFMKMDSATKNVRSGHIAGMGMFQFGKGKATHYILHSFNSYADLKKRLDAYMNNQDMGIYFSEIRDIATPTNNRVFKIMKQW